MIKWALIFLVVSLVAGIAGMWGVAGVAMDVAQFFFWGFLVIAFVFFALGIYGARKVSQAMR